MWWAKSLFPTSAAVFSSALDEAGMESGIKLEALSLFGFPPLYSSQMGCHFCMDLVLFCKYYKEESVRGLADMKMEVLRWAESAGSTPSFPYFSTAGFSIFR